MKFLARRQRTHEVAHTAGVDPSIHWVFRPGERVITREGLSGSVLSVEDGPHPGTESYEVVLDGGLGGGSYRSGELRVDSSHTAALASEDYPELTEVLRERPDPGREVTGVADDPEDGDDPLVVPVTISSRKEAGFWDWVEKHAPGEPGSSPSYDWCRFRRSSTCFYPSSLNEEATRQAGYAVWIPLNRGPCPRQLWSDQKSCPISQPSPHSGEVPSYGDATIPWEQGGQHGLLPSGGSPTDEDPRPWEHHSTVEAKAPSLSENPMHAKCRCGESITYYGHGRWEHANKSKRCHDEGFAHPVHFTHGTTAAHPGRYDGIAAAMPPEPVDQQGLTCPYCWGDGVGGTMAIARAGGLCGKCHGMGFLDARMKLGAASRPVFEFTATWSDVRAKAKRIRAEGGVRIISASPAFVVAEVRGDTNLYQSSLEFVPGTRQWSQWTCGCPWYSFAFGRSGRWSKYESRPCSHVLATAFEVSSRKMFGGDVVEDVEKPTWRNDPTIPVKVPGDYKRKDIGPWRLSSFIEATGALLGMAKVAATRYECRNKISPQCDSGEGTPPRKKCRYCGSDFRTERGSWGAFEWEAENRYHPQSALSTHPSEAKAQAAADQLNGEGRNAVVRWIHEARRAYLDQPETSPLVAMASSMVEDGVDPTEVFEFVSHYSDDPDKLMVEALRTKPFKGKVNGTLYTFVEIGNGSGLTDSLHEFPVHLILHPDYDPHAGLDFRGSLHKQAVDQSKRLHLTEDVRETMHEQGLTKDHVSHAWRNAHRSIEHSGLPVTVQGPHRDDPDLTVVVTAHDEPSRYRVISAIVGPPWTIPSPTHRGSSLSRGSILPRSSKLPTATATTLSFSRAVSSPGTERGQTRPSSEPSLNGASSQSLADLFLAVGGLKTAQDDPGVMVALVPPEDVSRALLEAYEGPNPESLENQHITVLYLGKTSQVDEDRLTRVVESFALEHPPITGHVGGYAEFRNGEEQVTVALWDIPGIEAWVTELRERFHGADITPADNHGFCAHETLGYHPEKNVPLPELVPEGSVDFSNIVVSYGGKWSYFEFGTGDVVQKQQKEASLLDFVEATSRLVGRYTTDVGEPIAPHYMPPEGNRPPNPDATRFNRLNPAFQDKIRKRVLDHNPNPNQGPLTQERMVHNIMRIYRHGVRNNPGAIEEGMHWYNKAHDECRKVARESGVSMRHGVGMMAALSPQCEWDENVTQAHYVAHHLKADTKLNFTPEHRTRAAMDSLGSTHGPDWAEKHGFITNVRRSAKGEVKGYKMHPDATPEKMHAAWVGDHPDDVADPVRLQNGKHLHELEPDQAAHAIKAMGKYQDHLRVAGAKPTKRGDQPFVQWSNGLNAISKAIRVHRGEDPNDVLSGHKVRSFHNCLSFPNDEHHRQDVTMDTHAVSLASNAMVGSKATKPLFDAGANLKENTHGAYALYADAYREAHHRLQQSHEIGADTAPHQLQAATWLHWRHLTNDKHLDRNKTFKAIPHVGSISGDGTEAEELGEPLDPWVVPPGEHVDPDHDDELLDELPEGYPYHDPDDEGEDDLSTSSLLKFVADTGDLIEKAPTAPEGWDGAAPEACDRFEDKPDSPGTCKNCWWGRGAHSTKAGGPNGYGGFGPVSTLHDKPEPALPTTDGEKEDDEQEPKLGMAPVGTTADDLGPPANGHADPQGAPGPGDPRLAWLMNGSQQKDSAEIAGAASAYLQKQALKDFTPAEQAQLINEGEAEGVVARNLDALDLANTHYEMLEEAMRAEEEEEGDALWLA